MLKPQERVLFITSTTAGAMAMEKLCKSNALGAADPCAREA